MRKLLFIRICLFCLLITGSCAGQRPASATASANPDFLFSEYSIAQLQQGYTSGDYSIRDVVQAFLGRIAAVDDAGPTLNAVIQVNPDALQIADELDAELKAGKSRGPLHGVPVLLKDNIDTHDRMETTAGSRALKGSRPLQDSWVAQKLREAGAVILGKTNLSEWANFRSGMSSSGWSGVGGQTKNPYVLDRNPCGSSSGSGAAVSANLCIIAIGTETNGSIICPANANGIVGIKPTVGLISRAGIVPISHTQDTPGPMARTVADAAVCLGALVGEDADDLQTKRSAGNTFSDYTQFLKMDGLKGKRIGLFTQPLGRHRKVDSLFALAVTMLKNQGAEVIELESISESNLGAASFEVLLYEFKDGLNRYLTRLGPTAPVKSLEDLIAFNKTDSIECMFDQELLIKAQAKGDLDTPEYLEALEKMLTASQKEGLDRVMAESRLDAIAAPSGAPAWKTDWVNGDHFILGSSSPAARAGYPNISVPMGFVDGLPVGLSFFGRAWSEPVLLEIAFAYEQATRHRKPPLFLDKL
ncbi:MAG: amidase [Lewinellaceae bacterium]|nr:amidase [Lewinellaceae bacterium]